MPETLETIGRYTLIRELASTSWQRSYEGVESKSKTPVLIKVLRSDSHAAHLQLLRENQTLQSSGHPHIAAVLELGTFSSSSSRRARKAFVVTPFFTESIGDWCAVHRPRSESLTELFDQASRGLLAAHRLGVVHGGIYAGAVVMDQEQQALLTEFGFGQLEGEGDPRYPAPEQWRSRVSTPHSDQFQLCALFYQLFCGRPAYNTSSWESWVTCAETGLIHEPLEGAMVPSDVLAVLRRGLAASPSDRFPTMKELVDRLSPYLPSEREYDHKNYSPVDGVVPTSTTSTSLNQTVAYKFVEPYMLLVHTQDNPHPEEWSNYVQLFQQAAPQYVLVVTLGGAPRTFQRAELLEKVEPYLNKVKVAILTKSTLTRGIITAVSWFNKEIRGFAPHEIYLALDYLKVPLAQRASLLRELKKLQNQLHIESL